METTEQHYEGIVERSKNSALDFYPTYLALTDTAHPDRENNVLNNVEVSLSRNQIKAIVIALDYFVGTTSDTQTQKQLRWLINQFAGLEQKL